MDWGWGVQWALWAQWGEICITIIIHIRTPILRTRTPTPTVIPMGPTATRLRRRTPAEVSLNHQPRITSTLLRGPLPYSCTGKSRFSPLLVYTNRSRRSRRLLNRVKIKYFTNATEMAKDHPTKIIWQIFSKPLKKWTERFRVFLFFDNIVTVNNYAPKTAKFLILLPSLSTAILYQSFLHLCCSPQSP